MHQQKLSILERKCYGKVGVLYIRLNQKSLAEAFLSFLHGEFWQRIGCTSHSNLIVKVTPHTSKEAYVSPWF